LGIGSLRDQNSLSLEDGSLATLGRGSLHASRSWKCCCFCRCGLCRCGLWGSKVKRLDFELNTLVIIITTVVLFVFEAARAARAGGGGILGSVNVERTKFVYRGLQRLKSRSLERSAFWSGYFCPHGGYVTAGAVIRHGRTDLLEHRDEIQFKQNIVNDNIKYMQIWPKICSGPVPVQKRNHKNILTP